MNNLVKNVIIFSVGVGVGALAGMQLTKNKYMSMAEQEIEAMREYNRKKKKPTEDKNEEQKAKPVKNDHEKAELTDKGNYKKITRLYSDAEEEAAVTKIEEKEIENEKNEYDEYEKISTDANRTDFPAPYIIDITQFSEEMAHFDKINLYYYAGDDTLADVDEDAFDDPRYYVGDEALNNFDECNTVYVRNERLAMDYEIIRVEGSYRELVIGSMED